jgi:tRNA1Val (adenine37-N6)-methyltransferase
MKVTTLACIQGAWLPEIQPERVLDIGAGTGVLTLMAAQKYDADFDAVEIDVLAYEQLCGNVKGSKWAERIECHHRSIQSFANENSRNYDLIIANPPFFQNQLKSPERRINVARHENTLTVEELIGLSANLINENGIISILLPVAETKTMLSIAGVCSLFPVRQLIIRDNPNRSSKAAVTWLSGVPENHEPSQLVIRNEDGQFTSEYKTLLSAYYLNL